MDDAARAQAEADFAKVARPLQVVVAAWRKRLETSGGLRPAPGSVVQAAHDLSASAGTRLLGNRLSQGTLAQMVHVEMHSTGVVDAARAIQPLTMRTLARSAIEVAARVHWQFHEVPDEQELLRRTGSLWLRELESRRKLSNYSDDAQAMVAQEREAVLAECSTLGFEERLNRKDEPLHDLVGAPVPSATDMARRAAGLAKDAGQFSGLGGTLYRLYSGTSHGWPSALMEYAIGFDPKANEMSVDANLSQAALTLSLTLHYLGRTALLVLDQHGLPAGHLKRHIIEADKKLRTYLDALMDS